MDQVQHSEGHGEQAQQYVGHGQVGNQDISCGQWYLGKMFVNINVCIYIMMYQKNHFCKCL